MPTAPSLQQKRCSACHQPVLASLQTAMPSTRSSAPTTATAHKTPGTHAAADVIAAVEMPVKPCATGVATAAVASERLVAPASVTLATNSADSSAMLSNLRAAQLQLNPTPPAPQPGHCRSGVSTSTRWPSCSTSMKALGHLTGHLTRTSSSCRLCDASPARG